MTQRLNLEGVRFGRLLVASRISGSEWLCKCDCGADKITTTHSLRGGKTSSCGCYRREATGNARRTHGQSGSLTNKAWSSMKARCYIPSASGYERYGGRGITVCARWIDSFENFLEDMGECAQGFSLERKEVDGNYEPLNCKWIPKAEQARNRRDSVYFEGMHAIEWAKKLGLSATAVIWRLKKYGTVYPPEWANPSTKAQVIEGKTLVEWAECYGVTRGVIRWRLEKSGTVHLKE